MPRRRKVEVKEELPKDEEVGEVDIKAEVASQQEDVKGTPGNEAKPFARRSLRPRKTKCYTERDSPEEEPETKVLRKRRRPISAEDDLEENKEEVQSKFRRTKKSLKSPNQPQVGGDDLEKSDTQKSALGDSSPSKQNGKLAGTPSSSKPKNSEDNKENIKPKRKRKRPRKTTVPVITEIKTEPPDTPQTNPAQKDGLKDPALNNNEKESGVPAAEAQPQPKPRPKRRKKRKIVKSEIEKKPAVDPETQVVIKTEPAENVGEDGESKEDWFNLAPSTTSVPKKVLKKKRKRPKNGAGQAKEITVKSESNEAETAEGEGQEKGPGENVEKNKLNTATLGAAKKRVRSRPKKPAPITSLFTEADNAADEKTLSSKSAGDCTTTVEEPDAILEDVLASRKPFGRGRRSRFLSVRTGKKEVVHTDEAIDPEDIRGFEHVERYSTPDGIRLPKFWDSEDEISDDENGESFRRIMCGFGTNCRIHEVIRPASEIVRRLKELQTTFGTTKPLPLFQRDETSNCNVENEYAKANSNPGKFSSIIWHNNPMYFQYANNFP